MGQLWAYGEECVPVELIAHACRQGQELLRGGRQPTNLARHQIDDVVRHSRLGNGVDGKGPSTVLRIEGEQTLLLQCLQELDYEERVAIGLFLNQPGEWFDIRRVAVQRVAEERGQIR